MLAVENIMVGMHMDLKSSIFNIVLHSGHMKREEREAYERAVGLLEYVGLELGKMSLPKSGVWGPKAP